MKRDHPAVLVALPVGVVAVAAGWQSYTHICALAIMTGQPVTDARLLPVAVDGLIVAGSVILLAGSALGWLGVVPGIAATVSGNVMSAVPHGPLAATVAAWPAAAFIVASFMLERWLKAQAGEPVVQKVVHQAGPSRPAGGNLDHPDGPPAPEAVPAVSGAHLNGSGLHPAEVQPFAEELARGQVPAIRRIRSELHVGQPKAQEIRARLAVLARTP